MSRGSLTKSHSFDISMTPTHSQYKLMNDLGRNVFRGWCLRLGRLE